MSYDFSDPRVHYLIGSTHLPVEIDSVDKPGELQLVCKRDQELWPCPTISDYDAYDDNSQARPLPVPPIDFRPGRGGEPLSPGRSEQ